RCLMAARLKVTQVKSKVSEKQNQRDTLRSLGLKRIGDTVVRPDDAQTRGYVRAVAHLVKVEEIDEWLKRRTRLPQRHPLQRSPLPRRPPLPSRLLLRQRPQGQPLLRRPHLSLWLLRLLPLSQRQQSLPQPSLPQRRLPLSPLQKRLRL